MTEKMPQSKADEIFKEMLSGEFMLTVEDRLGDDVVTFNDFFRHLKEQGYSDNEIVTIFDLGTEGDENEI